MGVSVSVFRGVVFLIACIGRNLKFFRLNFACSFHKSFVFRSGDQDHSFSHIDTKIWANRLASFGVEDSADLRFFNASFRLAIIVKAD